jgi:integrase/recombinase XerC
VPRKPRRLPVTGPQLDALGGPLDPPPGGPLDPAHSALTLERAPTLEHGPGPTLEHDRAPAQLSAGVEGGLSLLTVRPLVEALVPQPFEAPSERRVLESFLEGRSKATKLAYKADLESFAEFTGDPGPETAIARLLASQHGAANGKVLEYRNHIRAQGLSPATVNRRLATLRSMVKLANMLGRVSWTLNVEGLDAAAYRDTAGPGLAIVQELLSAVEKRQDTKGKRDLAILRMLFDLGLRRGEVVGLDVQHVSDRGISILGKGRTEREMMKLPPVTRAAINGWLAVHPVTDEVRSALFVSLDPAARGLVHQRLTAHGIYVILSAWSTCIDKKNVRPHGVRHTAITTLLDVSNGNLRAAQSFARHRSANTTMRYDDNRLDVRGEAAVTVSRLLPSSRLATVQVSEEHPTDAVVEINDPGALLALLPDEPKPTRTKKKKVTAKWFTDEGEK